MFIQPQKLLNLRKKNHKNFLHVSVLLYFETTRYLWYMLFCHWLILNIQYTWRASKSTVTLPGNRYIRYFIIQLTLSFLCVYAYCNLWYKKNLQNPNLQKKHTFLYLTHNVKYLLMKVALNSGKLIKISEIHEKEYWRKTRLLQYFVVVKS